MTTETYECPKLLAEFAEGRRGWHTYPEKLGCWAAYRNLQGISLKLLVTPNWRDKESPQDWIAEAIDSSNGNERVASYRGTCDEVTAEIGRAERTFDLIDLLSTCLTGTDARQVIEQVRGEQLDLIRRYLDLPRSTADVTRARIVRRICGFRIDMAAAKQGR